MFRSHPEKDDPWIGGFNELPPETDIIDEDEFWSLLQNPWGIKYTFMKQIFDSGTFNNIAEWAGPPQGGMWEFNMYRLNYHDIAIGYIRNIEQSRVTKPKVFVKITEPKPETCYVYED